MNFGCLLVYLNIFSFSAEMGDQNWKIVIEDVENNEDSDAPVLLGQ